MKKRHQIQIESGESGFHISFSGRDTIFVAKSVDVEPAPSQPGSIVWMADAKLIDGSIETLIEEPWELQPFMAYYLDKNGEEIGEELLQYMADRCEALTLN